MTNIDGIVRGPTAGRSTFGAARSLAVVENDLRASGVDVASAF
jgi:hypothetical protein